MGILIGVSGVAGSGKDTVANYLVDRVGFIKVSFADPMKRIVRDVFDFSETQLWGPSEERNKPDKRYLKGLRQFNSIVEEEDARVFAYLDAAAKGRPYDDDEFKKIYLTPRYALQTLGTEFGRNCYENIWVEYALRLARTALASPTQYDYTTTYGLVPADRIKNPIQGVVIADCRFENEMIMVKEAGGFLIRVKRPGAGLSGNAGAHSSEKEQLDIPDSLFDFVVDNDGTLEYLEQRVLGIYNEIKRQEEEDIAFLESWKD